MSSGSSSSGRPAGGLRRLAERLTRTAAQMDSDDLRRDVRDGEVVDIQDARDRARVTVCGEIRCVTLRPRVDIPALDVELWDGTGSLHLVWLGRRQITGIRAGLRLRATGRVTTQRHVMTIFNPAYEVIGRGGTHD